jgi:CBS domain-containing protein
MSASAIRPVAAMPALPCVSPSQTLREACRVLNRHGTGAVAVVQDGRLVGLLRSHDILRRCVGRRHSADTPVAEAMTPTSPGADAAEARGLKLAG